MSEAEFLSSWVPRFRACGADVLSTSDTHMLSGWCRVRPGNVSYATKVRVQDEYVAIYVSAPYPLAERSQCFELISYINCRLYKGHFNIDPQDGKIVFKFLIPLSAFANEESPFYRELVILPVAMVRKFEPSFRMLAEGKSVEDSFKSCEGGWQ